MIMISRILIGMLSNKGGVQHKCRVQFHCTSRARESVSKPVRLDVKNRWSNENAHRDALEKKGREQLGVKELDDWYNVKARNIRKFTFIRTHYGSLYNALKKLYPQHDWDPLRFYRLPKGYWTDEDTQREALERFGRERLGVKELNDWYSISAEDVYTELNFIVNYYSSSLFNALKHLYPHHNWDPLRFSRLPRTDEITQREALDRFGREKLGVKELDDWYHVSTAKVHRHLSFITKYGSLFNALKKFYPQHEWDPLRFTKVPKSDEHAYRAALDKFGREQLGVKELNDWYSISALDVHKQLGFLKRYGSLFNALRSLYPHHDWDPLKFSRTPHGYWQHAHIVQQYRKMFIQWKDSLHIRTVRDWYSLHPLQVRMFQRAAKGIFGSTIKMLEEWFPDTVWHSQFTSQLELQNMLRHVIVDADTKHHKCSECEKKQLGMVVEPLAETQLIERFLRERIPV